MRLLLSLVLGLGLTGCAAIGDQFKSNTSPAGLARTPGEIASDYGYVPLDPLSIDDGNSSKCELLPILQSLPDIAVRFAVASVDATGGLNFGPSKTTVAENTYRAVLDYVNVDALPVNFLIRKTVGKKGSPDTYYVKVSRPIDPDSEEILSYEARLISLTSPAGLTIEEAKSFEPVTIPVYVGVGLRLSADIRALKGDITLSGLGAIGAQAEASNLTGTLTVQTLGVTGKSIAVALPLPSKLDQTTIESGILAIGGSRAILYTADSATDPVTIRPRVVGLYSPVGSDPRLINAIYSELSRERPPWQHPCKTPAIAAGINPAATASGANGGVVKASHKVNVPKKRRVGVSAS